MVMEGVRRMHWRMLASFCDGDGCFVLFAAMVMVTKVCFWLGIGNVQDNTSYLLIILVCDYQRKLCHQKFIVIGQD